jgi:hypothetical protein
MEEWKDVRGYEGLYQVSTLGAVRSLDHRMSCGLGRWRVHRGKSLAPNYASSGYAEVKLSAFGTKRPHKVHLLVLGAFVGPRPADKCGLHRDDDRRNNALGNLYYGTRKENADDAVRNGKQRPGISLGERHGAHKLKEGDIPKILSLRQRGVALSRIAGYFGVTDMTIHDVVKGKTWTWLSGLRAA